ncbi:polyisoprenoid-binding protein [Oligella ureolytica]
MKKLLITSLFSAVVAGQAFAAPQTYQIDSTSTFPSFSYTHMGLSTQQLRFVTTPPELLFYDRAKLPRLMSRLIWRPVNTGSADFDQGMDARRLI